MQNPKENKNTLKEEERDHRKRASTKVISKTTIRSRGKFRKKPFLPTDHSKDEELINCGLKKLVSSLAMAKKTSRKPSKTATLLKTEEATVEPEPPVLEPIHKPADPHIILTDKCTMTDLEEKYRQIDNESTVLKKPQSYRDLQWRDPRLLKKYSIVQQPKRKTLTMPYLDKGAIDEHSEAGTELMYSRNTHFIFKCLYYFCTRTASFIGFMCGLVLIALILSKFVDKNMLNFYTEPARHQTIIRRLMVFLWVSVVQVINATLGSVVRLLTVSTNEVLAQKDELSLAESWLSRFY